MPRSAAPLPASTVGVAEHVKSPDPSRLPLAAAISPAEQAEENATEAEPSAPSAASASSPAKPERPRSAIPAVDTPVMRQYLEIKDRYPDCIVFFRLGDFYEMFFDDAVVASQLLDLTLTARDKQKEVPVPMAGIPHHAAKHYIGKLLAHGKKVAICDQVEDARKTKKIVRRAVTQVITPGVVLEEEQLEPKAGHYLAALAPGTAGTADWGVAYLDASTGEFAATQLGETEAIEELARIEPAELLVIAADVAPAEAAAAQLTTKLQRRLRIPIGVARPAAAAQPAAAIVDRALLAELLAPGRAAADVSADEPSPDTWPQALAAAAACMRYARATQPVGGLPLFRLRLYRPTDSLVIDDSTKTNLELLQTLMERKRQGSLLGVLDQTRTAMGGRLLRRWLLQPLQQLTTIRHRHDAVEWLVDRHAVRKQARELLDEIHDLERLTGRVATQVAVPRDLYSLQRSLAQLPAVVNLLRTAASVDSPPLLGPGPGLGAVPELLELGADMGSDVEARIAAAITDNPPAMWREGGFIRRGFNAVLDELVDLSQGGKDHILRIEERERERTGITSLKVRYNKVFGYYIEITRSNLGRVPSDYIRKQTTANAERYVTAELAEYEGKVLHAEERRIELEIELFEKLRSELTVTAHRLLTLAQRVAQLDALAGLAEVAHRQGYVRPEMTTELGLSIEDGRHPVVEQLAERGKFVPNDTILDPDQEQILLLTGPNMAGKSTVMRQVALICIMAQLGSFVPARRVQLGIVDRVCTRVGASDNLTRGDSTFMVEMRETSQILQLATRRSLVVLDEIGRGTSTYDGVSIAWAVAEYLHDVVGCKTLFATHYHELCALAAARPRVRNFSVAVRQWQDEIVFLHKLIPGGANRSYGIEVARLAGLPRTVLGRAREILAALETASSQEDSIALPVHGVPPMNSGQLALFLGTPVAPAKAAKEAKPTNPTPALSPVQAEVLTRLRGLDCDHLTPRAALDLLSELATRLQSA